MSENCSDSDEMDFSSELTNGGLSSHLTNQRATNKNSKLKNATNAKRGKTQINQWKTRPVLVCNS